MRAFRHHSECVSWEYPPMLGAWFRQRRKSACRGTIAEATITGPWPPEEAPVGNTKVASTHRPPEEASIGSSYLASMLRPPEEARVGSCYAASTLRPPEEAPIGSSNVASMLRSSVGAARSCWCSMLPPRWRRGPLLTELAGCGNLCCYRWAPPPGVSQTHRVLARVSS